MSAWGRPDWGAPLATSVWAAFEAPERRAVLPHALTLASDANGAPDLRFVVYRAAHAGDGTSHGVLDARIVAAYDTDTTGTLQPVARAFLRLEWLADTATTLAAPEPLWWSASGEAELVLRIAQDGVALIENSLQTALPLRVVADVEVDGVAPRVDARADVDVQRLVRTLREQGGDVVARESLRERLLREPEALAVALRATPGVDANMAVAALVDQLRAHWFGFAPSNIEGAAMLALPPADAALPGRVTLDLSAVCVAPRAFVLALAPFDEAARLAGRPWREIVEWRELLPLAFGDTRLRVETNLPAWSPETLKLVATLTFAPNPPSRRHALSPSLALDAAQPVVDIGVRLARNETPRWTLRVDAILPVAGSIRRLAGAPIEGSGTRVVIGPAQIPVALARVEASPGLLALADVDVTPADSPDAPLHLTAASPRGTVCVPAPAAGATLRIVARGRGADIALDPRAFGDLRVDLSDFPQYGTQSAAFDVTFDAGPSAVAVETRALDANDDASSESIAFDPSQPRRDVAWRCRDPFRCGLRWRWRAGIGEAAWPWSEPLAPGAVAQLAASERLRAS